MPYRLWAGVLCTIFLFWPRQTAFAGGIDYSGAGTQALGRGGAVAARADDPMVLMYNPAGLVELRGTQLMLNVNLALMDACVDPIGYYGWGAYAGGKPTQFTDPATGRTQSLKLGSIFGAGPDEQAYYTSRYDTVCMEGHKTPVPELGLTARLTDRFGVGIGMMFPSVTPQGQWGGRTGLITDANGNLRPAATRYMMMNAGTIGMFPTIGLAYRIADWLRIGGSFTWGVINVDNTTMAGIQPGTTPANDSIARVKATDWFVPEVTASVHIVPVDAIDIVGGFHYQADLDAPGTIAITTGTFSPSTDAVPETTTNKVTGVKQKFPMQAWAALRYASRLAPRSRDAGNGLRGRGDLRDLFSDERWDLELDVRYEMNARHKDLTLEYVQGQNIVFRAPDGSTSSLTFPDPTVPKTVIQKRWQDQVSVRVGGTYNVVPGLLGFSIGGHYENRGVDPSYMQIDYWPLSRVGLHFGVRVRIAGSIDLFASYAHIFQETLVVGAPRHETIDNIYAAFNQTKEVTAIDKRVGVQTGAMPLQPLQEQPPSGSIDGQARFTQNLAKIVPGQPPYVVNSGTYRSSLDVLSVGANLHF